MKDHPAATGKILLLAAPRGFCGGVRNAVAAFNRSLAERGAPLHVLHELVHNRLLTAELTRRGAVFVEDVSAVPPGAAVLFGAHGVAALTTSAARLRGLEIIDATCPLVRRLQEAAARLTPDDTLIMLGHRGHPEVEGVIGHAGTRRIFVVETPDAAAGLPKLKTPTVLVQTTLNHTAVDALFQILKRRFPDLRRGGDICAASRRRQLAVEFIARRSDLTVIIGSRHSSNANRLRETAEAAGCAAILIDRIAELPEKIRNRLPDRIGLSAGASTPDDLIREAADFFNSRGFRPQEAGPDEAGEREAVF